jgi:hypothetical protein
MFVKISSIKISKYVVLIKSSKMLIAGPSGRAA